MKWEPASTSSNPTRRKAKGKERIIGKALIYLLFPPSFTLTPLLSSPTFPNTSTYFVCPTFQMSTNQILVVVVNARSVIHTFSAIRSLSFLSNTRGSQECRETRLHLVHIHIHITACSVSVLAEKNTKHVDENVVTVLQSSASLGTWAGMTTW